jgi:hypothetical protein
VDEYFSEFYNLLPGELSGGKDGAEELLDSVGIDSFLSEAVKAFSKSGGQILGFFTTLLAVAILLSLGSILGGELASAVSAAVGLCSSALLFSSLYSLFSQVAEAVERIGGFFASLIPITAGLTALGGGVTTAGVQSGGMYLTLTLLGGAGGKLLSSLSLLGLSLSLLSPLDREGVGRLGRGVRGLFLWILGIVTAALGATLALQTLIASAADGAAIRAAKHLASGLIPVVGSTVSSALSTLAGGLGYAKGVVGCGSIFAILLFALPPLLLLLCYRLSLSVAISLCDFFSPTASAMLSGYRNSLDMLLSSYSLSALIFIFQIILFIKSGVALAG